MKTNLPPENILKQLNEIAELFDDKPSDKVGAIAILLDAWRSQNGELIFNLGTGALRTPFLNKLKDGARIRKNARIPSPLHILSNALKG